MREVHNVVASAFEGCYEAGRTAALSGVPISTVYDWARKGVVKPRVSATKPKRWSYADLMTLRVVSWLRHPKARDQAHYRPSPMTEVRRALERVASLGLDIWTESDDGLDSPLLVQADGRIVISVEQTLSATSGQGRLPVLNLLGPFESNGLRGPNLIRPRPHLRIVPGKVAGEPHLQHSRITTQSIAALLERGYKLADIIHLYPDESPEAISEAAELEAALAHAGTAA